MSLLTRLRTVVLRSLLEPSVRQFLVTRMSRDEADRTLEAVWHGYAESAAFGSEGRGFGPTQVLHLAAITIALHQALNRLGTQVTKRPHKSLVDVGWVIYRKMGAVAWMLSRARWKGKL